MIHTRKSRALLLSAALSLGPAVLPAQGTQQQGTDRGHYTEAESVFKRQERLEPARTDFGIDATVSLVQLYISQGRLADARAAATRALARATQANDSAQYLVGEAAAALIAGDSRDGIRLLEAARQKARFVGDRNYFIPIDLMLANAHALYGNKSEVATYLRRLPIIGGRLASRGG
jgi:tetratricopeptide (TPR) repeat protein